MLQFSSTSQPEPKDNSGGLKENEIGRQGGVDGWMVVEVVLRGV